MDFESTIRQFVPLGRTSNRGWAPVVCRVCNDHGKKGARSGFNFHDGLAYNCFNCEISFKHHPHSVQMPSKNMVKVFEAFGIPDDVLHAIELEVIQNRTDGDGIARAVFQSATNSTAKVLSLPPFFTKLSEMDDDSPIKQLAYFHLIEERQIQPDEYPFFIGLRTNDPESKKWSNRLIIPIYNTSGDLIFWQGRDLIGKDARKYLSSDTPRDAVLYGMDAVTKRTSSPLFITEGFFDAFHLQGCATLGRTFSPQMVTILNGSTREKIVVPDRLGDGQDLAMEALRQGWKISTPDFGQCKDVTDAVLKYGKLYVIKTIMDNIYSGTTAETMIGLYCK